MLIGLTGTYCSGKNYVAALLEKRGLPVLDVDKLGYQTLEAEKESIFAQFGPDLKRADGSLDRRLLGKRTFGKPEKLASLEAIVHPTVNRLTDEWIAAREKAGDGVFVINAALLHKSTVFNRLDRIILVTAPFFTRLLRAKQRDKLSLLEIMRRFSSQKWFKTQYLTVNANPFYAEIHIVENPGIFGSGSLYHKHNVCKKLESRIDKCLEGIR